MKSCGLDAAHYYSAPGMAWDTALNLTGVKLNLFDTEEMYTFIERSIRGDISQISKRFAKANNKHPDHDPLKHISYLIYLNANNLYGWSMSQHMPTKHFRWLTEDEIENIVMHLLDNAPETGYIFEVDQKKSLTKLAPNLHDKTNKLCGALPQFEILFRIFNNCVVQENKQLVKGQKKRV